MPHCPEAWDAVSRYTYTGLQGGSIMKGWMKKENTMITCCSDGTGPVIFRIERIDEVIPSLTLVKLGMKLMDEKRMADFYRMILDMEYRKKLLEEAGQAGGGF